MQGSMHNQKMTYIGTNIQINIKWMTKGMDPMTIALKYEKYDQKYSKTSTTS